MERVEALTIAHDVVHKALKKFVGLKKIEVLKNEDYDAFVAGFMCTAAYFFRIIRFQVGNDVEMAKFLQEVLQEQTEFMNSQKEGLNDRVN